MRLLHTSDWHLGRRLYEVDLVPAQERFLRWLLTQAVERAVDAVVVAGDVYDRAVPPVEAVALLDRTLAAFAAARVPVLLTSGNHDSAVRLGFGSDLAAAAGVHLRTDPADLATPVLLTDDAGPVGLYGIPYLLPDAVAETLGAPCTHTAVLGAAAELIRADAARRGLDRVVVAAHAFVTGGTGCDSERDLRVGGIGDADAAVFTGFSYTALGHLHGAQVVRADGAVQYCGSPLAFSFSESGHTKSVTLVDLSPQGEVRTERLPTPVPRRLREVTGTLDELLRRSSTDLADCRDAWVRAVLTDTERPHAPLERLREVWPHTLVLDLAPAGLPPAPAATDPALRDPVDLCADFVAHVDARAVSPDERALLARAVESARAAEHERRSA